MRSILLCLGLLSGCSGLWGPFLGEAEPVDGGGADGGAVADLAPASDGTCVVTNRVRGNNGTLAPTTRTLHGVWGAHDDAIWAVGEAGVVLHWDGGGDWHVESEVGQKLHAVWGPNDSFVAAATQERAVLRRSEVGYWGPQPAGALDVVYTLGGAGLELQLAGGVGSQGGAIIQYSGSANAWEKETALSPGSGFGVTALSVQGTLAGTGTYRLAIAGTAGTAGGFLRVYEGASKSWARSWGHDDLANPVSTAVLTGNEVFTADTTGGLVRFGLFGGATAITRPSKEIISKLRPALTAGRFWAVGDGGLLAYWDGTALGTRASGTTQTLLDAWQSPTGVLWVVGAGGTILRCAPQGPS